MKVFVINSFNPTKMRNVVFFLSMIFVSNFLNAQNDPVAKTEFTKMYLPVWFEAIEHCVAVAEAMPDELYDYKPTAVSKTFGEQMVHIATSTKLLTQRYVEGLEVKPGNVDAKVMTKLEIIEFLKTNFSYTTDVILNVGQDKLNETCKMYHSGNVVSRAFALFYVQDHLANHRAKANLYIRMNSIAPPEYTW